MPHEEELAAPMLLGPHTAWYHRSPQRLQTLLKGSTVTPVVELARAFSHKPASVNINIRENESGRTVTIEHDGKKHGYLYKALVDDPGKGLTPHPESSCAPGEEMLTTRDLPLRFIEEVPLDDE